MYALDMCPSIGLNRAVIVVGGCEGKPRGKAKWDGDEVGSTPDGVGT